MVEVIEVVERPVKERLRARAPLRRPRAVKNVVEEVIRDVKPRRVAREVRKERKPRTVEEVVIVEEPIVKKVPVPVPPPCDCGGRRR